MSSTGSEYQTYQPPFCDMILEVGNAFRIKQSTVQHVEDNFSTLHQKSEGRMAEIEKVKSTKYFLENQLKMVEYRMREYKCREKECSLGVEKVRKDVNDLKLSVEEETNNQTKEENEFDQKVISLHEKCVMVEIHIAKHTNLMNETHLNKTASIKKRCDDQRAIENEIKELSETNSAIAHELENIQQELESLKLAFHTSPDYVDYVISSCDENRVKLDLEVKKIMEKIALLMAKENELKKEETDYEKKLDDIKLKWSSKLK